MGRRWGKIEKDFCSKNNVYDISKIPDIYDCIKYDLQHNQHTLQFDQAEDLYINSKYLADIVIPQVTKFTDLRTISPVSPSLDTIWFNFLVIIFRNTEWRWWKSSQ